MSEGQEQAYEEPSLTAAQSGRKWIKRVLRGLWASIGITRKAAVMIALVVSIFLNGLLIFSSTVSGAVTASAAAMGLRSVAARQANELSRTTAELAAERSARDTAERINRRQANELARITAEAGVITGRVNKRWQNAATREIAAMPAEALPLVGVGVIVAATAWEITDMCATVRDMSELERLFDPNAPDSKETATVCGKEVPDRNAVAAALMDSPSQTWEWVRGTFTDFDWPDLSQDDVKFNSDKTWDDIKQILEDQHDNLQLWWNGNER